MSLSNMTESDILDVILKGIAPSWRSGGVNTDTSAIKYYANSAT